MRTPQEEQRAVSPAIRGQPAAAGQFEGTARVVLAPGDYHLIRRGDVLVTTMTSPAVSAWMPLLGAIVTDHGGVLSHAAIVARESSIPAVVATRDGTVRIRDGQRVRVDGAAGTVELLSE
jgi:pyruvate,water dikinase